VRDRRWWFQDAEHDADLFANLVDENQAGIRFRNGAGEFAHGLRHEARLHTHVGIAHFAIEFGFRHERGDGIDNQDVNGTGGNQRGGDSSACSA